MDLPKLEFPFTFPAAQQSIIDFFNSQRFRMVLARMAFSAVAVGQPLVSSRRDFTGGKFIVSSAGEA